MIHGGTSDGHLHLLLKADGNRVDVPHVHLPLASRGVEQLLGTLALAENADRGHREHFKRRAVLLLLHFVADVDFRVTGEN